MPSMSLRSGAVLALPLIVTACATPAPTSDELSVRAADEAFYQASLTKKAIAWKEVTAKDGTMLGVKGPDAVGKAAEAVYADPADTLTWHPDWSHIAGDVGITSGPYESRSVANGKATVSTGRYVTVWRRQADGRWLVAWDGGTPDHP